MIRDVNIIQVYISIESSEKTDNEEFYKKSKEY